MHNGNGHGMRHGNGHGNGKRWLLIGLLILGGFWLVSDAYSDGFRDALVQTGQTTNARFYRGGPDFPWEVLILGGIGYVAWRKGAFDRLTGPGGPFGPGGNGNGERGVQQYGGSGQGAGMVFRGPRALFEEWHREAHEAERARSAAPPAPRPTPPPAPAADPSGNGVPGGGYTPTPPPPPPAPDYWASMTRAADAASDTVHPSVPTAAPAAPNAEADASRGATGPALERW